MIRSFADKRTARLFAGRSAKGLAPDLVRRARRKLADLDATTALADLGARRGNRLEKLSGDRAGQWSIRVERQWRVCFVWRGRDAFDVELVDYH